MRHYRRVGERAQCVIMDGRTTELYYTVWGAHALDVDLVAGPEAACERIRRRYDPADNLLEPVWIEAAALIDLSRRVLAVFSWHCEGYAHRAALRAVLAHTWPGWDLRWAYDGVDDLAAYSGAPYWPDGRSTISPSLVALDPADLDEFNLLVTVADPRGPAHAYGMWSDVSDAFWAGPALLDQLSGAARVTALPRLPDAGLHLDPATRTVTGWTTLEVAGLAIDWAARWPGWRLEFQDDRYDLQLAHCAGGLRVPRPTVDTGLDILALRVARISDPHDAAYAGVPTDFTPVYAAITASRDLPAEPPRWPPLRPVEQSPS